MTDKKDEKVTVYSYKKSGKGTRKTTRQIPYKKTSLAIKEEWISEKKTKEFERLQAVSRNKEYMKEYKKLKELDGTYPEIALREEYVEKYKASKKNPVYVWGKDYQKFELYLEKNEEYQEKLLGIQKGVEKNRTKIIEQEVVMIKKWNVEQLPCLWFPDYIIQPQVLYPEKPAVVALRGVPAIITNPLESGKLYVQIDLSRKRELINKELKTLLDKYPKSKNISCTEYDQWEIYDMKHRYGMSLSEIAREKSGSGTKKFFSVRLVEHDIKKQDKKSAVDNPEVERARGKVRTAYNNAVTSINAIRPVDKKK